MKIQIKHKLTLTNAPKNFQQVICDRLTFQNPVWLENEKMGRWNGKTPEDLHFYRETKSSLIVPRGFIRQLIGLCRHYDISFNIEDQRHVLPEVNFTFHGQLKTFQQEAVDTMLAKDFGTLSAPTGSGKTVMALFLITERRQPVLIVVHTKELLNQWISRIENFLGIPADEIGVIGAGKKTIGARITVALIQSLYKCADDVSPNICHLIVDECHRAPSRTFTEAVTAFDSKYMLGLSATPWRRDKLSKLIFWHLGDVHHEVDKGDLEEQGHILKAEVISRETTFQPYSDPATEYSQMLSELTEDAERNRLIAADITREATNGGGICLVLSDRKSHCEAIQTILQRDFRVSSEVLTGDLPNKQRQAVIKRLNEGKIRVLVATGQLIGEGFDCKELSTLFLATPISFSGRLTQYLGRVLRPAAGKDKARIYDYLDAKVGVLKASAQARQRVYNQTSIQ